MNVSDLITKQSKKHPDKIAVSYLKYQYNFSQFEAKINQFANKFMALGVKPQDKVLFFVKPNLDFAAITFALFRLGAITVFIDPGMKRDYFLQAIEELKPDVLVGIPKVHVLRLLKPKVFQNIRLHIHTGSWLFPWGKSLYWGLKKQAEQFSSYTPKADDLAAILYTSGGTGAPKGVEYQHEIFINQTRMLKEEFKLSYKDIDIPGFPLFSFFSLAIGMRSHVPNIDVSKPSEANAEVLFQEIEKSQATFLAGSPAIWERLADYCLQQNLKLPSVKYAVMFGAPVSLSLHDKFNKILPQGTTYTPYGATECLPVANISGAQILKDLSQQVNAGRGICVGKPLMGVEVKIIKAVEDELPDFKSIEKCEVGEVGEIIVHSKNVTQKYYAKEKATKLAKIYEGKKTWHRMGDVGYLDEKGRIWFCGRKKHVVRFEEQAFYPAQIETVFNKHRKVKRSALVRNLHNNQPAVVIQRKDGKNSVDEMLLMDLKNLAQTHEPTKKINHFLAVENLPVDVRHNIKIDREQLAKDVFK